MSECSLTIGIACKYEVETESLSTVGRWDRDITTCAPSLVLHLAVAAVKYVPNGHLRRVRVWPPDSDVRFAVAVVIAGHRCVSGR